MAIRLVARPQRCERRERNEFAKAFMFEGILRCPTMPSSVKCEAQTLRARRKKLVIARERALPGARMSKSLHMVQPLFRGSSPGGSLAWGAAPNLEPGGGAAGLGWYAKDSDSADSSSRVLRSNCVVILFFGG